MGGGLSLASMDPTVEKYKAIYNIPQEKIEKLWHLYCRYDKDNKGSMSAVDFFAHVLRIRRSKVANAMLDLIDTKNGEYITFPEFVGIICTFAMLPQNDLIRFCFFAIDNGKIGTVEKNELKHFIYDMWDDKLTSDIHVALQYLDEIDDGDSRYTFEEFFTMHSKYPQLLYPVYRLQQVVIQNSLGEIWWEYKQIDLFEGVEDRLKQEMDKEKKKELDKKREELVANDVLVKKRMGAAWYLLPWTRDAVRRQIADVVALSNKMNDDDIEQMAISAMQ